ERGALAGRDAFQRVTIDARSPRVIHRTAQRRGFRVLDFCLGEDLRAAGSAFGASALTSLLASAFASGLASGFTSGLASASAAARLRLFSLSDLKSVSYQPEPFSRNTGADMSFFSPFLPQVGHFFRGFSLIFCSTSSR